MKSMKSHTLRPFHSERSTNGEWTGCALFRGLRPTKILRARSAAMCQLTSAPFEPSAIKSIAQRLRNREISALDLSATYLQQIEQTNKALNSFVCLNAEAVLEQAIIALGGKENLDALVSFSIESRRVRYVMGQGPEPGIGLHRYSASEAKIFHKVMSSDFRGDFLHTGQYI